MKPFNPLYLSFFLLFFFRIGAYGIVKYEEGSLEINGVTLLQDHLKSNIYYYVPNTPRLSQTNKGDVEFSCIKYVSPEDKETSGGLFHALFQFSLPNNVLAIIQRELTLLKPNAQIVGPVPLAGKGFHGVADFRLVSSILTNTTTNPFDIKTISSGKTSIENSKGAIAIELNPEGTTLLWESFQTNTSDVSIVLEGFYEASVTAYQAIIKADLHLIYDHFDRPEKENIGYTKNQVQAVVDSLCQNGLIDIEIINKSNTLNFEVKALENIVNIITENVSTQLFKTQTGWTKLLPMDNVENDNFEQNSIINTFLGHRSLPYVSSKTLLLKSKNQIKNFRFYLNLEQSTTIKVPIYTASNLGNFYEAFKEDKRYFSVVTLDDPTYLERDVYFQIDGNFLNSFEDILNHASIKIQKRNTATNKVDFRTGVEFYRKEILAGESIKTFSYKRGDNPTSNWREFDYKVAWDLIGIDTVLQYPKEAWLTTESASISIAPPFDKAEIEVDIAYDMFKEKGIKSARVKFASILLGQPRKGKAITLREKNSATANIITVYSDFDTPIVCQVDWYTTEGKKKEKAIIVGEDRYLFLTPTFSND